MAIPTKVQHPLLQRPGTSQRKRMAESLSLRPDFAPIDGRKLGDLLDYIYRYARLVVFHEHKIDPEGRAYVELSNWLSFFERSLPFILNRFAKSDFDQLEVDLRGFLKAIEKKPDAASLRLLLDLCHFELITPLDRLLQSARQYDCELVTLLERTTRTALLPPLRRFIELSNAAAKYFCTTRYEFTGFTKVPWDIPIEDLFVTDKVVVDIPGGHDGAIMWLGAKAADAAQRLLDSQRAIAAEIPRFLKPSIEVLKKRNEPHLGLLFAFLRLFEHFQGDLNGLTQEHLEFFYFHVLRLKPKDMEPDQAHLVFENAKHLTSHLIAQGTQFKDAKDSKNIDILFGLDEEIVIDKAKVTALKTLSLNPSQGCIDADVDSPRSFVEGVYVAPVADTADGKGEAFQDEQSKNWATLGAKVSKYTAPDEVDPQNHPFGRIGFILASPVLWLNEGRREVTITIECDASSGSDADPTKGNTDVFTECFRKFQEEEEEDLFDVRFSGEDGWFKAERGVKVGIEPNPGEPNPGDQAVTLTFEVTLGLEEPAVAFYEEQAIGEFFATENPFPMVKIELNPEVQVECDSNCETDSCCLAKKDSTDKVVIALYHFLRHLRIKDIEIEVKVCGVKNLIVQNEESLQDVNSPILPFGARPKVGAEFYVGSKEVFCKHWQKFWLHFDWKDKPALDTHYAFYDYEPFEDGTTEITNDSFIFRAAVLDGHLWIEREEDEPIFDDSNEENPCEREIASGDPSYYKEFQRGEFVGLNYEPKSLKPGAFEPYNVNSDKGFFRMTLDGVSFQHDRYPFVLARKMIELSGGLDPTSLAEMRKNLDNAEAAHSSIETKISSIGANVADLDGITALDEIDEQHELDELKSKVDDIKKDLDNLDNPLTPANEGGVTQLMEQLDDALEKLNELFGLTDEDVGLPKEPYTPLIKELELDYRASAGMNDIELIHLYPFAKSSKTEVLNTDLKPTLLPTFTDEGTLFIGLTGLRKRSNLHLLFQFAEATADSESDHVEIAWHYLAKNEWHPLRPGFEVLSDATEHLTRSGIVKIAVPEDISNEGNTVMPPTKDREHLFWLKVSAPRAVAGAAELVGVHAQAALATYGPLPDSDPTRVATPLEPKQIGKTLQPDFGIKKVEQPYESFGGRVPEAQGTIPVRMSEQLRHKGRSVDAFDIEHLVLDAFPELFKCKCISHSMGLSANEYRRDLEVAPGFLIVAVVPDLTKLKAGDMLEPKAPVSTLTRVKKFLKERVSPFARVRVMNPRYEKIRVSVKVRLKSGRDENFYRSQLETDLIHFLAPWHLGDSEKLSFGQHVVYSDVVGFLEGLEYIDHVTDLRLFDFQSPTSDIDEDNLGLNEIVSLTARSILTGGKIKVEIDRKNCDEEPALRPTMPTAFLRKSSPIPCGEARPFLADCESTTDPGGVT